MATIYRNMLGWTWNALKKSTGSLTHLLVIYNEETMGVYSAVRTTFPYACYLICPVSIIPPLFHAHFHLTKKDMRSLVRFQKAMIFRKSGTIEQKRTLTFRASKGWHTPRSLLRAWQLLRCSINRPFHVSKTVITVLLLDNWIDPTFKTYLTNTNFNIITSYNPLSHIWSPVSRFYKCKFYKLPTFHILPCLSTGLNLHGLKLRW
jgi:hypothetical protein